MPERRLHLVKDGETADGAGTDDGGRPPGGDDLDPELISLKRFRPTIGPLLALSVIGLCIYLLIRLYPDLRFGLGDKGALDFGDAADAYTNGQVVPDNAYVTVHAIPDRGAPGWLRTKNANGHRVVPVLGTSGRLWVSVGDRPKTEPIVYDERYQGRTRRLADLALGDELRAYLADLGPQPRFLDPKALATGMPTADIAGDKLHVSDDTPVRLDERVANTLLITVYSTSTVKDDAAARKVLTDIGLAPAPQLTATELGWTFEVPGTVEQATDAIGKARLYAVSVEEKIVTWRATWRDLAVDTATGTVRVGPASVPVGQVARVAVLVPMVLGPDATVLMVGETPAAYWYVAPLCALLALFLGLMVWALVRGLKQEEKATAS